MVWFVNGIYNEYKKTISNLLTVTSEKFVSFIMNNKNDTNKQWNTNLVLLFCKDHHPYQPHRRTTSTTITSTMLTAISHTLYSSDASGGQTNDTSLDWGNLCT